jgi:hypothetical protein
MKKSILELEGAKPLTKEQQKLISGGNTGQCCRDLGNDATYCLGGARCRPH